MSSRTAVLVAIVDQVQANKIKKSAIDIQLAAKEISSMHPQSGMLVEEIEQVIAGMAARAGVPVMLAVSEAA